MIIRSQNKKELHNLDRISNIRVFQLNNGEAIVEVNWQHSIGRYSTEEKAIKVLDMICRGHAVIEIKKVGMNITADLIEGIEDMLFGVFEMPQDSEV